MIRKYYDYNKSINLFKQAKTMHDAEYFAEQIDEMSDATGDKKFKCKRCDVVSKYKVKI